MAEDRGLAVREARVCIAEVRGGLGVPPTPGTCKKNLLKGNALKSNPFSQPKTPILSILIQLMMLVSRFGKLGSKKQFRSFDNLVSHHGDVTFALNTNNKYCSTSEH